MLTPRKLVSWNDDPAHVTGEASLDWAERQRALRSLPEAQRRELASEGVRYSFFRRGRPHPLVWSILIVRGIYDDEGTYVALHRRKAPVGTAPSLVFRTSDDAAKVFPGRGEATVFGQVEPGGALGLRIGDRVLWPTYLPRAGRPKDPAW